VTNAVRIIENSDNWITFLSTKKKHYYDTIYSSSNIIRMIRSRRMRWAGHVARMGEKRNAYRTLVGKPEGNRPLGGPRSRWVDDIKMDLREI
jgi:hypothetical protein